MYSKYVFTPWSYSRSSYLIIGAADSHYTILKSDSGRVSFNRDASGGLLKIPSDL